MEAKQWPPLVLGLLLPFYHLSYLESHKKISVSLPCEEDGVPSLHSPVN